MTMRMWFWFMCAIGGAAAGMACYAGFVAVTQRDPLAVALGIFAIAGVYASAWWARLGWENLVS